MILGITSLPSVTNILTWKEFGFVQSKLGWLSLCCGTAHDLFNGYNMDVGWDYFVGVKCNFFLHGGLVSFHKIYFRDHPFETSACLKGVSPCADGQNVTVHNDQKSPL